MQQKYTCTERLNVKQYNTHDNIRSTLLRNHNVTRRTIITKLVNTIAESKIRFLPIENHKLI